MGDKTIGRIKSQVAFPPADYIKKIVNKNGSCPLSETFTREQIERRIAFYQELNQRREQLPKEKELVQRKYALYGWKDTTTVRVYMRETVSRIVNELFYSHYSLSVDNIYSLREDGEKDKDHGYVVISIRATMPEIKTLLDYIKPGSSYYVYDGEESKYVPGKTWESEFMITKIKDTRQPAKFWRRSQSFIAGVEERT